MVGSRNGALEGVCAVILDMDGVLWHANDMIHGSAETTHKLGALGIRVYYLTNNSLLSRHELQSKLIKKGCYVEGVDNIFCSSWITAQRVARDGVKGNVLVYGSHTLIHYVDEIPGVTAVSVIGKIMGQGEPIVLPTQPLAAVVLGFDRQLSYYRYSYAVACINRFRCDVYCTNPDQFWPSEEQVLPGTGTFMLPITSCIKTGKEPIYCGKPDPGIGKMIADLAGCKPTEIMMIGDNLDTDILFGSRCGYKTALVLSGVHKEPDIIKRSISPDYVLNTLADLSSSIAV